MNNNGTEGFEGMGNALNNNISKTFSCPPTIAVEKTSSDTVCLKSLACLPGKKALRRGRLIRCRSISQFQMDTFC
ncbi:hypothetical protein ACFX2I_011877 [Malus domestica]